MDNSSKTFNDVYYDMRLTFSGQDKDLTCLEDKEFRNNCKRVAKNIIQDCVTLGYFSKYTGGIEELNKKGESCPLHLHLRFESNKTADSMRRRIKEKLEKEYNQDTLGNKHFMFKAKIVRDYVEFFQYPLKQNLHKYVCGGYTDERLTQMHEVAKSSYMKVIEVNQAKENRKDENDTLFERAYKKCADCKTQYDIADVFLELYLEENRPINSQIIKGYVLTTALKMNILTKRKYLESLGFFGQDGQSGCLV